MATNQKRASAESNHIPLAFGDAVGGLLRVDPKKLPARTKLTATPAKGTLKAIPQTGLTTAAKRKKPANRRKKSS